MFPPGGSPPGAGKVVGSRSRVSRRSGDGEKIARRTLNHRLGIDLRPTRYTYAVRICPEPVHWGGLSGCTYSEGVSWGKFVPESDGGRQVEVYADATIAWPMIVKAVLERLEVDAELPIAWITIPHAVMTDYEATSEDLEGLIDYARDIEKTEVALLFRETVEGGTKVSLRSNGIVDVNAIARQFGGGGHKNASGCTLAGPLDAARAKVLERVAPEVAAHAGPPAAPSSGA